MILLKLEKMAKSFSVNRLSTSVFFVKAAPLNLLKLPKKLISVTLEMFKTPYHIRTLNINPSKEILKSMFL